MEKLKEIEGIVEKQSENMLTYGESLVSAIRAIGNHKENIEKIHEDISELKRYIKFFSVSVLIILTILVLKALGWI